MTAERYEESLLDQRLAQAGNEPSNIVDQTRFDLPDRVLLTRDVAGWDTSPGVALYERADEMADVVSGAPLDRVGGVRSVCAQALAAALQEGHGCSERELADRWLTHISSHDDIVPEG